MSVTAQKQRSLLLKNGNAYYGVIVSRDSGKIKLMGHDLNTYVFDTSEVLSFVPLNSVRFPSQRIRSGFAHDVSFGISLVEYRGRVFPYGLIATYSLERTFMYRHSLGLDFSLFINADFAPTLGLKYRFELLPRASTPFVSVGFGNYADPFWSAGWGSRYNGRIGYQWGGPARQRKYLFADFTRTNGLYYGVSSEVTYSSDLITLGFGYRL